MKFRKEVSMDRLSKLQKWILNKCYEQGKERKYCLWRRQLVREYCKEVKGNFYLDNSSQVVITRSIRNLALKEYIDVYGNKENPFIDVNHILGLANNIKWISLINKGIMEIEKSLNVNK